jgi:hypothetical protein
VLLETIFIATFARQKFASYWTQWHSCIFQGEKKDITGDMIRMKRLSFKN